MYITINKIILAVEGSVTPNPAAKGTGINQYNVKNEKIRISDPIDD